MSEHTIELEWSRDTPDFNYDSYTRNHTVRFGAVGKICGSSAPEFHGDPHCLDPEQAFVMALSSCHMLTFLAVASRKGYVIDSYADKAIGELGKNRAGRSAIIKVVLRPIVVFSGEKIPSGEEFRQLHDRAHGGCIISNSISSCVTVIIDGRMMKA
jgi:organic hydroperoxide reductase OsmC/OhrA